MKKITICPTGNHTAETNYYCDVCGCDLIYTTHGIPYTLDCSYGSYFALCIYHFCSLKHLQEFVIEELKKET